MIILQEHPHDFRICKAFRRAAETPSKTVYIELRANQGKLFSFKKHTNSVHKALIVLQHGKKSPSIIKLNSPLKGKNEQLKVVLFPEHCEIALYVKSGTEDYADYFHPKFSKNSRLWAMFELHDGIYSIFFDSEKKRIDFGFQWLNNALPNPFDLVSLGLKPTFKFDN